MNVFNDWFGNILSRLKSERSTCFLMGDFNINLLNFESHNLTSDFVELLHSHSFLSLINRPTRITATSATLIDNIFTNCTNLENSFQGLLVTDVSDHLPIFYVEHQQTHISTNDEYIIRRNMSQRNRLAFENAIVNFDWNEMYQISDIQLAFSWFHSKFLKLYNVHFPKRKIKLKYNTRKMWLTDELKDSIKTKNKLYKNFILIPSALNERKYKTYRNKLNHKLQKAERQHYSDLLIANKNNLKRTWQIMKDIVNKNKTRYKY